MIDLRQAAQQAIEALDSDNPDIQLRAAVTLRAAMKLPVEAVISAWSLREVYFDEDGEPSMHRSPPQRPWVGLTDEEIEAIGDKVANEQLVGPVSNFRVRLARAIEQTLKERNG